MATRALSWLVFVPLMTLIISGSFVVVVCLYLPYVALKAVVQIVLGKTRARMVRPAPDQSTFHIG